MEGAARARIAGETFARGDLTAYGGAIFATSGAFAMQFHFFGKPRPELRSHPGAREAVASEQAKVREYYGRGIFRQVWMAEGGVVAICEADSRDEMDAHVADMPLFKAGLMDVELQELKPFRGFSAV